jgi:putative hemolysin
MGDQIVIIFLLIIANGIFAMSEMSIVSSHKARLETLADEGSKSAAAVLKLRVNPNKMFSTVQFGITLISLLTGVYGGTTMAGPLSEYVEKIDFLQPYAYSVSMFVIVAGITYFTLVLGELAPKRIAIDNPERLACFIARPMLFFSRLCTPIVWFLSASTALVVSLLGVKKSDAPPATEDEIKLLLEQGAELGAFEKEEPELVDRVFRLADMDASDIMTNRTQLDWLDLNDPEEVIIKELREATHFHLPVGKGSLDTFLGLASVDDIFMHYYDSVRNGANTTIKPILRKCIHKPTYIPESMDIMKVVHVFREQGVHEGVVLDEYGNFSGILTLHDILEELVGIMPAGEEEKREEENRIIQRAPNEWLMEGLLTIEEFKDFFDLDEDFPEEDEDLYKTLAGFVIYGIGRIPKETDKYTWGEFTFEVMDMDNLRVDKLLVTRTKIEEQEESE